MSLAIGTVIEMTRDAPYKEYGVYKGDIGIINYVAKSNKYSIHIYGKSNPHKDALEGDRLFGEQGDFWIPFDCVKEYTYKSGDRVEIISPKSKYKGHHATIYYESKGVGHCKSYVYLFVDGTIYQPDPCYNKNLTLVKSSVRPIEENIKGDTSMKLSGFKNVAVIEINGKDYHYALYDEVKAKDKVLVSGRMATDILTVKEVITAEEARERFTGDVVAEVKCKIDLSAYEQRVKNREEAVKLRKKMDEEIKKMDELLKYEMYASSNPALKDMLDKFKELGV